MDKTEDKRFGVLKCKRRRRWTPKLNSRKKVGNDDECLEKKGWKEIERFDFLW